MKRAFADRGYRGHGILRDDLENALGHTRGIASTTIHREIRRRITIEPVIGHMKEDGLLEPNHLAGPDGDSINFTLCAARHNMRFLPKWLMLLVLVTLTRILCSARRHIDRQTPAITA